METFNLYSIPVILITSNRDIIEVEYNSISEKEMIYFSFSLYNVSKILIVYNFPLCTNR